MLYYLQLLVQKEGALVHNRVHAPLTTFSRVAENLHDNGANGLMEDWSKVEWVCQRLDKEQSTIGKRKMTRDGVPSQQEEGVKRKR